MGGGAAEQKSTRKKTTTNATTHTVTYFAAVVRYVFCRLSMLQKSFLCAAETSTFQISVASCKISLKLMLYSTVLTRELRYVRLNVAMFRNDCTDSTLGFSYRNDTQNLIRSNQYRTRMDRNISISCNHDASCPLFPDSVWEKFCNEFW